jgi:two-component system OmpR family response regulator
MLNGSDPPEGSVLPDNLRVLVIEDEPGVANVFCRYIELSGMRSAWAQTGAEAMAQKATFQPDVVLVDLGLPDTQGTEMVRWLADERDCGIIVVSGLGASADRIVGLELGADDYIGKPPVLRELVARIRAVHRRAQMRNAPPVVKKTASSFVVGAFLVDTRNRTVNDQAGLAINLTSAEFAALEMLIAGDGQPVSRDSLSEIALHHPWRPDDRGVDQLILGLRRKLSATGAQAPIQAVRGVGYAIVSAVKVLEARPGDAVS